MQVVSPKSKYVDPQFDILCCGWVKLVDGRCPACNKIWKKEQTFDSLRRRFEAIVDLNRNILYSMSQKELDHTMVPVKISTISYAIPFRALKEFDGITSHERQRDFFELIQATCKKIQFV